MTWLVMQTYKQHVTVLAGGGGASFRLSSQVDLSLGQTGEIWIAQSFNKIFICSMYVKSVMGEKREIFAFVI